jgi:hypothetical protein
MNILNFAHPLTEPQLTQIAQATSDATSEVIPVRVQFDLDQPFAPQVARIINDLQITPERWQGEGWLIVLPSLNFIAAILLAELHGRLGYFPTIVRMRPVPDSTPPRFEFAELINLQKVRDVARAQR